MPWDICEYLVTIRGRYWLNSLHADNVFCLFICGNGNDSSRIFFLPISISCIGFLFVSNFWSMPYSSYQVVMLTWGELQSSDQSLNESLLPLLQKTVSLPRGPMLWENIGLWQLDQAVEVYSLSYFSLAEAQSKHLGPILVISHSPRFYHHILFELWGAQKDILFQLSHLSDYILSWDLSRENFLRNLRMLLFKDHGRNSLFHWPTKQTKGTITTVYKVNILFFALP